MSSDGKPSNSSRRNFLKIGAGVLAGAAVATVVEVPYYSSVVSGNNNSSSSKVSSLQDQLNSTSSQLADTQSQLTATQNSLTVANSTIGNLNSQLSSSSASLSSANGQIATLQSQVSSATSQVSSLQTSLSTAQDNMDTVTGFLTLSQSEQSLLGAIAEAMIPNDGNGPDANAAGVIYFIDRQLATDYGKSAHMYMQGPFVPPNQTGTITVNDLKGNPITYTGGSTLVTMESGMQYQYHNNFREFFRYGLDAFETYCNTAYGSNFEKLSSSDQVAALTDLYNNKPTVFNDITPADLFYELFVMVWSGYFMDPLYGGNRGMAAWVYSAFNGVNFGNFYGEGHTDIELMTATTPTRLRPASLAQYQKGSA